MHASPKSPITLVYEAIKSSARLRGVAVLFGAHNIAADGSPPRIVIVPGQGNFEVSEHDGNVADVPLPLRCHLWTADASHAPDTYPHDQAWDVITRLLQAVEDYQFSSDLIRVAFVGVDFGDEEDTRAGQAAIVTLQVRAPMERTALTGGEGDVDAVRYEPDADNVVGGPTINQTE